MNLKDTELEVVGWIHLAQVMDQWRDLVNMLISIRVS